MKSEENMNNNQASRILEELKESGFIKPEDYDYKKKRIEELLQEENEQKKARLKEIIEQRIEKGLPVFFTEEQIRSGFFA